MILALSSLRRNSRYVALFWIGIWFVTGTVAGILTTVDHVQRVHQGRQEGHSRQTVELDSKELEAAKTDWRPLVSYTANLSRIGNELLGTDACWERIGRLRPENQRSYFAPQRDSQWSYPWYWSAGVLAGLVGTFRMHSELLDQVAGPAEVTPIVAFHDVSKWYGNVIGINKLTLEIRPGVTGLLGPNGAGKSTLLQLATGQLAPEPRERSACWVRPVWNNAVAESLDRPVPGAGCLLRMDDRLGFRAHLRAAERAGASRRRATPPPARSTPSA